MHSMRSFIHKHSVAFEPRQLEQLAQDAIELCDATSAQTWCPYRARDPHESMPIDCDAEMLKTSFL